MKKVINRPESFVQEVMEGIELAYGGKVKFLDEDRRILLSNYPAPEGKVGIVTAGGSGHLPLFLGYVGQGMLDGCTVGNVFASPSAQKMADMIHACDHGGGVLCLLGNYGGDKLNFSLACETADFDGIQTETVIACDDVASSPAETAENRRGVAGLILAFKVAGAASNELLTLHQVADAARKALANTRTMGVALSPCIVPEVGKPSFQIGEDEIGLGMGIHGEPGIEVQKMLSADEIAQRLVDTIEADMPVPPGSEICVMVNGLGATPLEELLIIYRRVALLMKEKGVSIFMPHIGEFATSMEMAGLSVTVMRLDGDLKRWLAAPAVTPFYTSLNK